LMMPAAEKQGRALAVRLAKNCVHHLVSGGEKEGRGQIRIKEGKGTHLSFRRGGGGGDIYLKRKKEA